MFVCVYTTIPLMGAKQSNFVEIDSNEIFGSMICIQERHIRSATASTCLRCKDRRTPAEYRRNSRRSSEENTSSFSCTEWSAQADAMLFDAVDAAAKWQHIKPPMYVEVMTAWRDGAFADERKEIFWAKVAQAVPLKTKEECVLRYQQILSARVARFAVKRT